MSRLVLSFALNVLLFARPLCGSLPHAQGQAPEYVPDAADTVDPLDIPPESDPLAHAFDRPNQRGGLYLRASVAIGVQNTRLGPAPWEGPGTHGRGFGSSFGLDIGALVAPWLALHASSNLGVLWNGSLRDEVAIAGRGQGRVRVLAYGFAPAVTFFTPVDFRITSAFGAGLATIRSKNGTDTTDPGFYMNVAIGKDVTVSRNFALGFDFQITYLLLSNDSKHDDARVRQFSLGVSGAYDSI